VADAVEGMMKEATPTFHASTAYRRYVLGLLLVVGVLNYADRYLLGILIPDIKADLGLSDTQIGFISGAAFTIFYAFLGIPIARLADRLSRRKIIAVSLALWSAMTCLCGSAQSFMQLAVFRILVGVGEAGCTPPSHSLISDYYSRARRTSALAIYGLGSPVGVFVGFLVGGWLVELAGWRVALIAFGAPGVLVALIVFFTLRDAPRGYADNLEGSPKPSADIPGLWPTLVELWAKKTFRHMVLGGSTYAIGMVAVLIWIPSFFARTHGMEIGAIGTWLALTNALPHVAGTLAGGAIADHLGKKGVRGPIVMCVLAQVIATPFYALVFLWPNPTGAFLWLIIPSIIGVMQGPVLYATIQAVASVRARAVAAALMILIINLVAGLVGPQFVGLASDLTARTFGVESLGLSLLAVTLICGFWSAFHFYLASRAIENELR
jgi:MFS family permease